MLVKPSPPFPILSSLNPLPHTSFSYSPQQNPNHTHSLSHSPLQPFNTHTLWYMALHSPPPHTLFVTKFFRILHQYTLFVLQPPTPSTIRTLFCNGSYNPSPDALFVIKPSLTLHQTQYLSRVSP